MPPCRQICTKKNVYCNYLVQVRPAKRSRGPLATKIQVGPFGHPLRQKFEAALWIFDRDHNLSDLFHSCFVFLPTIISTLETEKELPAKLLNFSTFARSGAIWVCLGPKSKLLPLLPPNKIFWQTSVKRKSEPPLSANVIICERPLREAIFYQIGCFFTHCVNGPWPPPPFFIRSCCGFFDINVKKCVNVCRDKIWYISAKICGQNVKCTLKLWQYNPGKYVLCQFYVVKRPPESKKSGGYN